VLLAVFVAVEGGPLRCWWQLLVAVAVAVFGQMCCRRIRRGGDPVCWLVVAVAVTQLLYSSRSPLLVGESCGGISCGGCLYSSAVAQRAVAVAVALYSLEVLVAVAVSRWPVRCSRRAY